MSNKGLSKAVDDDDDDDEEISQNHLNVMKRLKNGLRISVRKWRNCKGGR